MSASTFPSKPRHPLNRNDVFYCIRRHPRTAMREVNYAPTPVQISSPQRFVLLQSPSRPEVLGSRFFHNEWSDFAASSTFFNDPRKRRRVFLKHLAGASLDHSGCLFTVVLRSPGTTCFVLIAECRRLFFWRLLFSRFLRPTVSVIFPD